MTAHEISTHWREETQARYGAFHEPLPTEEFSRPELLEQVIDTLGTVEIEVPAQTDTGTITVVASDVFEVAPTRMLRRLAGSSLANATEALTNTCLSSLPAWIDNGTPELEHHLPNELMNPEPRLPRNREEALEVAVLFIIGRQVARDIRSGHPGG